MELFKFGKKKMTKFISQYFDLLLNLTDDWQVTDISTHFKLKEIRLTITHIGKQCECPESFDICSIV